MTGSLVASEIWPVAAALNSICKSILIGNGREVFCLNALSIPRIMVGKICPLLN